VEYGDKYLISYGGDFGDAIVIAKDIKPKIKNHLIKFTQRLEDEYREKLQRGFLSGIDFSTAEDIAKIYFGTPEVFENLEYDLASQLSKKEFSPGARGLSVDFDVSDEISDSSKGFTSGVSEAAEPINQVSEETHDFIIEAISSTQDALNALIAEEFDQAEKMADLAISNLELALAANEPLESIQSRIEAIPKIVEKILQGIDAGRKNDKKKFLEAIQSASKVFINGVD
jgi:hypothetical protein